MFDDASRIEPLGPGRYRAEVDDSWAQGRGAYGGLVAAWLVRAFEHHTADAARPPRSITFHLAAPVPSGPLTVEVDTVRAGAHVSQLQGRLLAGDVVVATALATMAGDRSDGWTLPPAPAPEVPPADTLPPLPWFPGLPVFTKHVDYRFALGAPPYSGAARPELGGWCRFHGGATPDRALVAALLDVWPPAPMAALSAPRPMTTVDWTIHLHAEPDPATPHDAPWLFRALCTWADAGYAEEIGELWDARGRLVGRMRQLLALLPTRRVPAP